MKQVAISPYSNVSTVSFLTLALLFFIEVEKVKGASSGGASDYGTHGSQNSCLSWRFVTYPNHGSSVCKTFPSHLCIHDLQFLSLKLHLSIWTRYFVVTLCLDPTNGPLIQKKHCRWFVRRQWTPSTEYKRFAEWYPALATPLFKQCHPWWVLGSEICSAFAPSSYLLRLQVLYVCIIKEEIHFLVAAFSHILSSKTINPPSHTPSETSQQTLKNLSSAPGIEIMHACWMSAEKQEG